MNTTINLDAIIEAGRKATPVQPDVRNWDQLTLNWLRGDGAESESARLLLKHAFTTFPQLAERLKRYEWRQLETEKRCSRLIDEARKAAEYFGNYTSGSKCECDPEVGACPCEHCGSYSMAKRLNAFAASCDSWLELCKITGAGGETPASLNTPKL